MGKKRMAMNTNVDDLMRKTKTYWYEDGLVEILTGVFFAVIGLFLLLDWSTPQDAPYKWFFAPGFAVVTIGWILVSRKVIDWLKVRITYPRTGYIVYRQHKRAARAGRAIAAGVIGAAVSLAVVASLLYRQEIVRVIPLILGIAVALLLIRLSGDLGLLRFQIAAVWSVLIGGLLAWLTNDISLSIGAFYALLGPAFIVSGVVTLARYLHSAATEADDA
jgi:hypothetical protein